MSKERGQVRLSLRFLPALFAGLSQLLRPSHKFSSITEVEHIAKQIHGRSLVLYLVEKRNNAALVGTAVLNSP